MSSGDADNAWGASETRYFFELTPDRVLDAVEAAGFQCTGRCTALNSFENRVYEVELEEAESEAAEAPGPGPTSAALARKRVVKFYRPGRWSEEQIREEHEFLLDLLEAEIPVVHPLAFPAGDTLRSLECGSGQGIWYAIFPKVGGRAPDELDDGQLLRLGRLLARIHVVGARKAAPRRIELGPATYGRRSLEALLGGGLLPVEVEGHYRTVVEEICTRSERLFTELLGPGAIHRIHGDCHAGNLLWNHAGPFFLDFDDMARGPAVQDLWLLVPGRDDEARAQRARLLEGYEEIRAFDRGQLRLIEPLRALRFVHYSAWIARRWGDPAFPLAFPQFGSHRYWSDETRDLVRQLELIREL